MPLLHPVEQAIADIAKDIADKSRRIAALEEEIAHLKKNAEQEYRRGFDEGYEICLEGG